MDNTRVTSTRTPESLRLTSTTGKRRLDVRERSAYVWPMARPTLRLIQALRQTAIRLTNASTTYRWSSYAHCNCGHLAQTITELGPEEIQERALRREGDWGAQAKEQSYCHRAALLPDYGDRPALDEGGAPGIAGSRRMSPP